MKKTEADRKLQELERTMQVESRIGDLNRARSVTVGTVFGGTTELLMRGDGGRHLWALMQPVEVIELIHQLAANVGCHINLKPRDDFSSWRDWRVSEAEKKHLNNHAPHVNDMAVFQQLGASNFDQNIAEQIVAQNLAQKEYEYDVNGSAQTKKRKKELSNESTMATKKSSDQRAVKRRPRSS
jgi:hypothetical protein